MAFIDHTGQRFGRWTVLYRTAQLKRVRWVCRCECGTIKEVAGTDLRSGRTNSCGCLQRDSAKENIRRKFYDEYVSWVGLKQRCNYPRHIEFHRYGGRGIRVCDEWNKSFDAFLRDMGPRPKGFSIDRIDLDGPYSPENCRWASRAEQSANTSTSLRLEYEGRVWTLSQLAKHVDVNYYRLHAYFRRRGFSLNESIERARKPGINRPYRFKPAATNP